MIVFFHTFSGYIEISERTEDSSIWLRVIFCHNLFPHALTRDIFFELIIIHIFSTIAVQVEWLTNFDLNSDMNNV